MNKRHAWTGRTGEVRGLARLLTLALPWAAAWLPAATLTVGTDGWQDFTNIHDAYTNTAARGAAGEGDVIELYTGVYTNAVWVNGRPNRTFRAAPGHSPVWAAKNPGGYAVWISSTNTTVEGITFSGTNKVANAVQLWANDCRVANNTFLDISNHVATVYYLSGVYNSGSRNLIVSNRFRRFFSTSTSYSLPAIYANAGSHCRIEHNEIDTFSTGSMTAINGGLFDSWIRNNTISNCTRIKGGDHFYAIMCGKTNCVIEGNTVYGLHQWGGWQARAHGVYLGGTSTKATGNVVNDNTFIDCGMGFFSDQAAETTTNNLIVNNRFLACNVGTRPRPSVRNTFSNNVFVQSAGYTFYTEATYYSSNNWLNGNSFLFFGSTPHHSIRTDNLREYWSGNFYAKGTVGIPTHGETWPPPVTIGVDTDANAVTGFWARAWLPANASAIVVEHPANSNDCNATTRLVYDTTSAPGSLDTNRVGGVLFDVHALIQASTNGLPARRIGGRVGRTLRVAHVFADGTVQYSLRVAYRESELPFRGAEPSLQLFRFNAREYENSRWEPATEGNVVNAAFPANDILRVDGPPDAVLGHWGVDTAQNVAWANLNCRGDFILTVQAPPPGTILCVR